MTSALRTRIAPVSLILIAIAALSGCTKNIPITQYPVFWDRAPKTIAVTPFRNATPIRQIGMRVTSDLATKLSANGTYKVYDRTLLKAYLNEHDLQMAFSSDQDVAAAAMVKIGKVQAILTGAVTTCNWPPTRTKVKVVTRKFFTPNGVAYTRPVKNYIHTNEAELKANAALLRITPNGPVVIHSSPVRGYMKSSGPTPKYSREACLTIARAQVVQQLLEQFAVIRKLIKVSPSKAFFTATDQPYAGKWPKSKKFSAAAAQKIILVLMLPPQCDRNTFRITIARKEARTELATFDVAWTKAMSAIPNGKQFVLDPADLANRGGGPGDYIIRLFSGQPKPVIEHKIKITP
ncbi:MAG: CsgG/HfaB family protein [Phycisphaerae bacterium]|jgi:hypothetical protein|nr:CsgG/HfaB family protein [Phycisphaerae bacterium]